MHSIIEFITTVKEKDQQDLVINLRLWGVFFVLISSCGVEVIADACVLLIKIHASCTGLHRDGVSSKSPTCPISFGHQPRQAAGDFGSGEVVVLKGLCCWSNKGFLCIPDVLNFAHISPWILSAWTLGSSNTTGKHPTTGISGKTQKGWKYFGKRSFHGLFTASPSHEIRVGLE